MARSVDPPLLFLDALRRHACLEAAPSLRGLTVLAADIDVDVDAGASSCRPGQPGLTVHAAVAG